MKKILLLAAAAFIGLGASAAEDLDLKNVYVGGNVAAWRNQSANTTEVSILPEVGYNINDTWSVGTQIGYSYNYKGAIKAHNNSFIFDPYARWTYFRAGMVQLFVDGGVDFSLGRTSWDGGHSKASASFGIGVKPGVALNVNKSFGIVAHFGFLGYKGANDAAVAAGFDKGFGFNFSNALNFGFYYNF